MCCKINHSSPNHQRFGPEMSMLGKSCGQYGDINVVLVGLILFDGYEFALLLSNIASLISLDEDNIRLGIHFQVIILRKYALIGVEVNNTALIPTEELSNAVAGLSVIGGQDVRADGFSVGSNDAKAVFHTIPASQKQRSKGISANVIELEITKLLA